MRQATEADIGKFARSIESGWLGKVVGIEMAFDEDNPESILRMVGVNELCLTVAGGHPDDWIDLDDVQWFTVDDVRFVSRKGQVV